MCWRRSASPVHSAICSSVAACSMENSPACTRHKLARCAPQPSCTAKIVREGANIAAGRNFHVEGCVGGSVINNLEAVDLNAHRPQLHRLAFPRQFVGWNAVQFLRRKRRRDLFDWAQKLRRFFANLSKAQVRVNAMPDSISIRIVGVGGETKPDRAGIPLCILFEELRQPREASQQQRQHPRRHRIERAQVANRRLPRQLTHLRHHVVRCDAGGFVDEQKTIHSSFVLKHRRNAHNSSVVLSVAENTENLG